MNRAPSNIWSDAISSRWLRVPHHLRMVHGPVTPASHGASSTVPPDPKLLTLNLPSGRTPKSSMWCWSVGSTALATEAQLSPPRATIQIQLPLFPYLFPIWLLSPISVISLFGEAPILSLSSVFLLPEFYSLLSPAHLLFLLPSLIVSVLLVSTDGGLGKGFPHTPFSWSHSRFASPHLQMRPLRLEEKKPLAQGHIVVSRGPRLKQVFSDSEACALNNEETQLSAWPILLIFL